MHGDPHPRSAHRASPASGLASLSPTALVRQAQAGQARARQAILRQAQAGQARAHQAIIRQALTRSGKQPARLPRPRQGQGAGGFVPSDLVPDRPAPTQHQNHPSGSTDPLEGGQPGDRQASQGVGLQTAVRLAAEWQAAARQSVTELPPDLETPHRDGTSGSTLDRPAAQQHGQPRTAEPRRRGRAKRRAPRQPQQTPQSLLRGLAAVIVLAILGLSAFFIIAEERRGDGRESATAAGSEPGIASRAIDPEPLTQREVFPKPTVQLSPGTAGYQVTVTHSDSECQTATIGELGGLLDDHGCDHVVRARLTAPYGGYQVTAGIFNLADEAGAARVSDLAGPLVENGQGTFATLGGAVGDPLSEPLAQVGWHSRGHFLLYCVVARPDGQLVTDDDPYAATITAELIQQYLGERVVGQRTSHP